MRLPKGFADVLLGIWWVSWFGIIGGFLSVSVPEYKNELLGGSAAAPFSLTLLIVIVGAWIAFFTVDYKHKSRSSEVVNLLTVMGSTLAVFTIVALLYFVKIAPHLQ